MKHSLFSASGASRWANCPGSLAMTRGCPRKTSFAAAEGTAGHALGEHCILTDEEPADFIGEVREVEGFQIEITDELADAVSVYVEYVRGISGTRWLEQTIYYADLLGVDEEDGFGTGDCCILDGTTLHVIDAKFGRGYVNPVKNKQMILYAAGVVSALELVGERVDKIVLHIVQPRVSTTPVPYEMTRADLQHEVNMLRAAAQEATAALESFNSIEDKNWARKYLTPGESQCQWCPAAVYCPALRAVAEEFTAACDEEFGIVNLLEQLSSKELGKYQSMVGLVDLWKDAVTHETMKRLSRGQNVDGFKLVLGREGNRRWADPVMAAEVFADLPEETTHHPAQLKSPPQLEKALGKNKEAKAKIETLVVRNPAKPTLTTSDDPRPAWSDTESVINEFGVQA